MSVKISQLPNLTLADLTSVSTAILPIVANTGTADTTYQTTIGNVKSFVEYGNLHVTGAVFANLTSSFANVIVAGNLVVQGTTQTVSSQSLSSNASIIDLHTFDAGLDPWTVDDGKDIGVRFFWNKSGTAGTSALVWENSNTYLTWYGSGVSNANTGLLTGTLGTMQLGQLLIANNTPTTGNATGALQVSGGISTGGNLWVTGSIDNTGYVSSTGAGTFASLQANGATTLGSTLVVSAQATVNSLAVNSYVTVDTTLTTGGNATVNGLRVNASATVGTTLSAAGGIQNTPIGNVTPSSSLFTTVAASGNITASALTVNNSVTVGTTLAVTGNVTVLANINTGNVIPLTANTYTLGSSAKWFSTVYATATQTLYADLAEKYEADAEYEPGTVVVFGGDKEITTTAQFADTRVAGAVSTDPAYLMNSQAIGLPIALRGKIPVKVVGAVSKGDLLVTSTVPGYAESASTADNNAVFAKSLVNDDATNERVIWAVIL